MKPKELEAALKRLRHFEPLVENTHWLALYGSRANDTAIPTSDWDFVAIIDTEWHETDSLTETRHVRTVDGSKMDLLVVPYEKTTHADWLTRDLAAALMTNALWIHGTPPLWQIHWPGVHLRVKTRAHRLLSQISRMLERLDGPHRRSVRMLIHKLRRQLIQTMALDPDLHQTALSRIPTGPQVAKYWNELPLIGRHAVLELAGACDVPEVLLKALLEPIQETT